MLQRTPLVAYQRAAITPDLAEALRHLEVAAANRGGIRLHSKSAPRGFNWDAAKRGTGPTGCPPSASLLVAGREVHLRVQFTDRTATRWEEVATLWGLAVPQGLTPWNRYPMPGEADEVFHFLGPWRGLYDHLLGEGRGELAWPSVCCAAQVDVGAWEGAKPVECFVQAQLHRLGHHCGPVDGDIGPRTIEALRTLGLHSSALEETAGTLAEFEPPEVTEQQRRTGHIIVPGRRVAINTTGRVYATSTRQGAALTIDGPGRVIMDVH